VAEQSRGLLGVSSGTCVFSIYAHVLEYALFFYSSAVHHCNYECIIEFQLVFQTPDTLAYRTHKGRKNTIFYHRGLAVGGIVDLATIRDGIYVDVVISDSKSH